MKVLEIGYLLGLPEYAVLEMDPEEFARWCVYFKEMAKSQKSTTQRHNRGHPGKF